MLGPFRQTVILLVADPAGYAAAVEPEIERDLLEEALQANEKESGLREFSAG